MYVTQSRDTDRRTEEALVALLIKAGPGRRFELTIRMIEEASRRQWEAMRRRFPDLPANELRLEIVGVNYGEQLADSVRQYLERRRS